MLETSKDFLFVVIAICIAAFTIFSCWGLYYLIGMLRNVFKISKDARKILKKVEETIDAIKEKIHSSTSYLFLIGEAVKKILEIMNRDDGGFSFPFGKKKTKDEKNKNKESARDGLADEEEDF